MTILDGVCDFCEAPDLLQEYDKTSLVFMLDERVVLWCGVCREGSLYYFIDDSSQYIADSVALSTQTMVEFPFVATDTEEEYLAKMDIQDGIFRGKQELLYRLLEDN